MKKNFSPSLNQTPGPPHSSGLRKEKSNIIKTHHRVLGLKRKRLRSPCQEISHIHLHIHIASCFSFLPTRCDLPGHIREYSYMTFKYKKSKSKREKNGITRATCHHWRIIFSNFVRTLERSINLSTVLSPNDLMGAESKLLYFDDKLTGMITETSTMQT